MRIVSALSGLILFTNALADTQAQSVRTPLEVASESYSKHRDTRFGHDHFYPDRGAIIRTIPAGATMVNYAGLAYQFIDGIWYEPRGPAFMVVAPPIGLVVPNLPTFATLLARNGRTYIYCNDIYYRPRPDLNGYEVANDPIEPAFQAENQTSSGGVSAAADSADVAPSNSLSPAAVATPLEDSASASVSPSVDPPTAPPPTATAPQPQQSVVAGPAVEPVMIAPDSAVPPAVPAPASDSAAASSRGIKAAITPQKGQSADQQARDRYECYRFAVSQSGIDPMRSGGGGGNSIDYGRAQSACFEGRGYTVQ